MSTAKRAFLVHCELAQSWWAMEGLPRGGTPWNDAQRLESIAVAGFTAVLRRIPSHEPQWFSAAARLGLGWHATAIVDGPNDAADHAKRAADLGFRSLNLQIRGVHLSEDKAYKVLHDILDVTIGRLPVMVETHRGRITQDPWRTARWCVALPDLALTLDLSHYVTAYALDQDEPLAMEAFSTLISRGAAIHGRIANGHHVQIDVHQGHPGLARFARWWTAAMVAWRLRASSEAVFLACCELGPPPYHPCDAAGHEYGDRWAQSLLLRDTFRECWRQAELEIGRVKDESQL